MTDASAHHISAEGLAALEAELDALAATSWPMGGPSLAARGEPRKPSNYIRARGSSLARSTSARNIVSAMSSDASTISAWTSSTEIWGSLSSKPLNWPMLARGRSRGG